MNDVAFNSVSGLGRGYCYPLSCKCEPYKYCLSCSMMESADAIDDSDDEVDYTKMDQGNKKGPVGRWDFDTQEEYSVYMSNKEAMPK